MGLVPIAATRTLAGGHQRVLPHPKDAPLMSTRHYHNPVTPAPTRTRCPVCHTSVYSRAGIHPQCAIRLSDPPRPKPKAKPAPAAE